MAKNNWGNYTQSKVIILGNHTVFVSYLTPVAIVLSNGDVIRTKARFSRTTGKQISKFFSEYNVNRDNVKEVNKELFKQALSSVGYNGELGMLNNPYIQ
jgi:hypothetical protein